MVDVRLKLVDYLGNINVFSLGPKLFELVEILCALRENVNHNATVVENYPGRVIVSLASDRLFAKLCKLKLKLALKRAVVSCGSTRANYEIFGKNGLFFNVEHCNILCKLVVKYFYRLLCKFKRCHINSFRAKTWQISL